MSNRKKNTNNKSCLDLGPKRRAAGPKPKGYYEFYPVMSKSTVGGVTNWYIDSYYVDQELEESISENRYAFRISVKFLYPYNPTKWRKFVVDNLKEHAKTLEYGSTNDEIYDYLLSAMLVLNTYSPGDCVYKSAIECRSSVDSYCKKRHGEHYPQSPEISMTGYDSDDPDIPEDFRYLHQMPIRKHERTDAYMERIRYMKRVLENENDGR